MNGLFGCARTLVGIAQSLLLLGACGVAVLTFDLGSAFVMLLAFLFLCLVQVGILGAAAMWNAGNE